jgi:hypothetical protein
MLLVELAVSVIFTLEKPEVVQVGELVQATAS